MSSITKRRGSAKAATAVKGASTGTNGPVGGTDLPINWLDGIVVRRLEATPTEIPAFGAATLHWDVEAGPPVRLSLGGMRISHSGSTVINPTQTNTYRLMAFDGNESRFLGDVTVAVVHGKCSIAASSNIDELLAGALTQGVHQSDNLYFRHVRDERGQLQPSRPVVKISDNRFDFSMQLRAEVDWFPNPDVDVQGSFGLAIIRDDDPVLSAASFAPHTKLVASNVDVRVDVSFPWYAYAVPAGPIALPIVESMNEEKARARMTEGITTFVSSLDFVSPGLIKHGARIYVDGYGIGVVEIEFCPPPRPVVVLGRG